MFIINFERLIKRGQNVDDKSKTWNDFQKDLLLSTEVEIANLVKKSSYQLDNNGNLETLYLQVDKLVNNLQKNK